MGVVDLLDNNQFKSLVWSNCLSTNLGHIYTSYDILNISKERLKKWKEKEMTTWKEDNTCVFLTEDIIQHLEEKVYEEVRETIGE